jgi:hypothetical protein
MKRLPVKILIVLITFAWACGGGTDDPAPKDTSTPDVVATPDATDAGPDQGSDLSSDTVPSGNCIPPVGTDFRFTVLSVQQPTDPEGVVKDLLNDLWKDDIENDILNIIYRITAVDEETGTLLLVSASAVATDSEGNTADQEEYTQEGVTYAMIEDIKSNFEMSIDGCQLTSTAPGTIIMQTSTVGISDDPECADVKGIHLEELTFTTVMSADGTEIISGTINGILPGHVGDCVLASGLPGGTGVAFGWFLEIATVDPNLDTDDDGVNDAWIFDAEFKAVKVDNVAP